MRTAQEMYDQAEGRNLLGGMKKRAMKDFQVIENNLMRDETVRLAFSGISNYKSMKENDGVYAYVITDKRIMRGRKEFIIGEKFSSISLKFLNDIHFETATGSGMLDNGVITFDTMKETLNVCSGKKQMQELFNEIQELIHSQDTP